MDTPKWNRHAVVLWILKRDSRSKSVRAKDARACNSYMYREAVALFGSWTGALAAAGINLPPREGARTWSPKKVINAIQRASVKPELLCYKNVHERRRGLLEAAKKYFGSWRKALMTAGIDPESVRLARRWTREALIEAILDRAVKNEPLAVTKVLPNSLAQWGIRLFGSWGNALRAAGLDPGQYVRARTPAVAPRIGTQAGVRPRPTTCPQKWSKDRIAARLRKRVSEGKPINMARLKIEDRTLHGAIRRHFGRWTAALLYAGLAPEEHSGCHPSIELRRRASDI